MFLEFNKSVRLLNVTLSNILLFLYLLLGLFNTRAKFTILTSFSGFGLTPTYK